MSKHITLYLTKEEYEAVTKASQKLGMTFKEYLLYALKEGKKSPPAQK